jgi:hypothetical protein
MRTVPKPTIKVLANNDQAMIIWKYTAGVSTDLKAANRNGMACRKPRTGRNIM